VSATLDLDQLIEAWRGPLIGLFAARGVAYGEAIELAQDVFAEAWIGRGRFQGAPKNTRAVGAWLSGIARNLHRASSRKRRPEPLEQGLAEQEPAPEASDHEIRAAELRRAIEALPDRERAVVQAFYFEETSSAHVAALLGIAPRAVEGLLRRARARLKESLESASVASS
jgi:RNA polymerase sigma-70 factor, ECF subfamily